MLPIRIGLTGGIGSGKSTVAKRLEQLGAAVIDTDLIARELTLPGGAAIEPIKMAFGAALIEPAGALDRAAMRALAFADVSAKRQLEAILHPLIGAETERRAARAGSTAPALVFDVPLLVESGRWRAKVHRVLVVDCQEATQIERVMARSGWSASDVSAVVDQQASRAQRRACADAIVYNDGLTPERLAEEIDAVWRRWTLAKT